MNSLKLILTLGKLSCKKLSFLSLMKTLKSINHMQFLRLSLLFLIVCIFFSLSVFSQDKAQVDDIGVKKLAMALASANTDEECNTLLLANKAMVTSELHQILINEGNDYLFQSNYS